MEFKSAEVRPESLARELVAFANTSGGVVLIGVDDSGALCGMDAQKNLDEWITNIARNNVSPPITVTYNQQVIDGKIVGVVDVPKGKDKPYQDVGGKFYVRVGSTNRIASPNELVRLFQLSGLFHFDITGIQDAGIETLNTSNLADYFGRYGVDYIHEDDSEKSRLLQNTDILTEDAQVTVGGMLVFGSHPQRYLKNASISFARFRGDVISDELADKQVIEGTLDVQIDTAFSVVKNHILTGSTIHGSQRQDQELYPDLVYRELIVNACVHRNYSISGSRIRIFLFSDRIEFISPGRLPNTITIEKLKAGVSYAVNPVILKFMENLRYIDKLGRGLPMVYQAARKRKKDVCFEEIGEEFKVTLYL